MPYRKQPAINFLKTFPSDDHVLAKRVVPGARGKDVHWHGVCTRDMLERHWTANHQLYDYYDHEVHDRLKLFADFDFEPCASREEGDLALETLFAYMQCMLKECVVHHRHEEVS